MTSKTTKTLILCCLILASTGFAFASGSSDNSPVIHLSTSTLPKGTEDVLPITVAVPQPVLDWFSSNGVDTSTSELSKMSISTRNAIKALYNDDNKSTINALALTGLKTYLQAGSVETVTTQFGPIVWTAKYDQSDED